MTDKEVVYETWAPPGGPWSPWVKPVLFACMDEPIGIAPTATSSLDVSWAPPPADRAAIVLDLPGGEGVAVGIALASLGYRPVPLYNALPMPMVMAVAAVDVRTIVGALERATQQLREIQMDL